LLANILLLTNLGLLLLLHQVAESTAAGRGDVSDAGTLKVVLAADITALHGFRDPVKTEAHRGEEEKARSVDWLISLHVTVLTGTVVSLAECHTWYAIRDQAGVNGRAAGEEAVGPILGVLRALGVDGLASIAQDVVEAFLPVVDIVVVNRAGIGWSTINWSLLGWDGLINWSRHFVL